ncbi:TonB-dependent receptor [Ferruginibacter lapsinanis]|uniref:TonB-dependent receptor n=1 Tax=Ferruginibacter lapsinanis TaxID=563172 RepID=UPI001E3E1ECC|nr:TonB-dependent receptor [Ferruginibacter lapsinanis]UEG48916.1 TonB-dependent receptor [Ferruginibacter lapsinanis]
MRKKISYLLALFLATVCTISANAQSTIIIGKVENSSSKEDVAAVSVTVKGGTDGTFTDDKGNFKLTTNQKLPLTLLFSSVGFEMQEVVVRSQQPINVSFKPSNSLGQEVVVSASRVPQKILESPVSIERVSAANIRNSPVSNFYDVVSTLKGVDITTSSLTFKTPTTRGFNSSGNVRFNQLVDGMDNQAPGLNFSVGAIIGLSELDVDNIELLSGASSALYGSGGMNGTLLMNSKNPFKYQGLSFLVKTGIMHTDQKQRNVSPYYNWSVRWAKQVSDKFAFKINTELIQAKDWLGADDRNYNRSAGYFGNVKPGTRSTDPNYDGVNVFGDETSVDIMPFLKAFTGGGAVLTALGYDINKPINVSRTGYYEKEVLNPNTLNFKLSGSLHYKITPKVEASLAAYWGTGNTVYTGASRYNIRDFKMGQYKFELNHKNWMLRAYTTQENAGGTFNATVTTQLFNESWKTSVTRTANGSPNPQPTDWYIQYVNKYLSDILSFVPDMTAHNNARGVADVGRPTSGTASFRSAFNAVAGKPVPKGGLLLDRTDLYNVEGNYDFSSVTSKVADIMVGASYKRYVLNSQGTLFADTAGTIGINEYGAYVQAIRQVVKNLKLAVSGRYDKNQNFDGRFTPRATAVLTVAKDNNIRLSYQTAYRFPSNQMQWINLPIGTDLQLIGGNKAFIDIYHFNTNPLYDYEALRKGSIVPFTVKTLKPESISSFELGYKGLLLDGKLLADVYGYYGQYKDFLGRYIVVQNKTGAPITVGDTTTGYKYSLPINTSDKVKTYGYGISIDYRLPKNFMIGVNVASDNLKDVPADFVAYFNAPKYKVNASLGNTGFGYKNRMGFNVAYRWQDAFFYQGDFANGNLPAVQTLDAQVSFKFPSTKSVLKLGANNLLNQYYYNAIGNSQIGGLYYVSFGYNIY